MSLSSNPLSHESEQTTQDRLRHTTTSSMINNDTYTRTINTSQHQLEQRTKPKDEDSMMQILSTGSRSRREIPIVSSEDIIKIDIPKWRSVHTDIPRHTGQEQKEEEPREGDTQEGKQRFTLFQVHMHDLNGNILMCEKRYSDFRLLHKTLKQRYATVRRLYFPPKRFFLSLSLHVIEQRRESL
jgi:hypothetical protein